MKKLREHCCAQEIFLTFNHKVEVNALFLNDSALRLYSCDYIVVCVVDFPVLFNLLDLEGNTCSLFIPVFIDDMTVVSFTHRHLGLKGCHVTWVITKCTPCNLHNLHFLH